MKICRFFAEIFTSIPRSWKVSGHERIGDFYSNEVCAYQTLCNNGIHFLFFRGTNAESREKERKSSNSCARIVPLHCCLRAIHRRTESFGRQVNFHLKKVVFLLEWFASQRQQNCITAIKEPAFALKMLINIFYETT